MLKCLLENLNAFEMVLNANEAAILLGSSLIFIDQEVIRKISVV
jgi:hypothetical protein